MDQDEALKRLKKENELLVMKLRLKEKYIKELEAELKQRQRLPIQYTKSKNLANHFVTLKIETTGLSSDFHDAFQIALVEFKDGQIMNHYMKYFRPSRLLTKKVTQLTGITNAFLEDKDFIEKEDIEAIHSFIGDKQIVAHAATFSMKFLLRYFDDFNMEMPNYTVLDTLPLARKLVTEAPNHKFDTLKTYFKLNDNETEDALSDAKTTGQLALKLNALQDS
ncbi:3'-5' exonuclease [Staphylococcus simulans]